MSVPKSKRKLSQMEYYHTALRMRKELTNLLFRDFGLKPTTKECRVKIKQDNKLLVVLFKFYIKTFNTFFKNDILAPKMQLKHPHWFIESEQKKINEYLTIFMDAVEMIYQHNDKPQLVRQNIEVALDECYLILKELQFIIAVTSLSPKKVISQVELINKEIDLLKGYFNRGVLCNYK